MAASKFSARTNWDTTETEWSKLLRKRRAVGLPIFDLTASNPTRCGFEYDQEAILNRLGNLGALQYDPDPKGLPAARQAVAAYYAEHGATIDPERVILTTSTSEAYSFLFRLLCDPGDEVLIAQPSYPLFDFLAAMEDVRLTPYPLFYDHGWHLDPEALRRKITSRTRALVVVHPNNPTGHFTKAREREVLEHICAKHRLALIVDEVFLDYQLDEVPPEPTFVSGAHPAMTFALSGLSKIAALPQMKAAWMACCGPEAELSEAITRLEVIGDTFLSMNAPVQLAMPFWLAGSPSIQGQILVRIRSNLQVLDEILAGQSLVSRLVAEAGWYAVLRVPARLGNAESAWRLLKEYGTAVHSGDSFGFGQSGWLVVSLLCPEDDFRRGAVSITDFFARE
jgi:aspartate/methionine/tyrosine aminotransferase